MNVKNRIAGGLAHALVLRMLHTTRHFLCTADSNGVAVPECANLPSYEDLSRHYKRDRR